MGKVGFFPWRRFGPGQCVCVICETFGKPSILSTNALARAAHERGKQHFDACEELKPKYLPREAWKPRRRS